MTQEQIQNAIDALDIALGRGGVFNPPELDFMCNAKDALEAAQATPPESGEAARKDYLRRLIAGVRKMIEQDPDTINAKKELGNEVTIGRWIDAELLCTVIEKDILSAHQAPPAADVRWRGRVARPEKCPSCGDTIGALASLVKLGNGPWTCDRCDGNVISKAASRQEVGND